MLHLCSMKKFIAVILLIIYGSVSVSASMIMHQCGNRQPVPASHHKSCHSKDISTNCCNDQESQCTVEGYNNAPAVMLSKVYPIEFELVRGYHETSSSPFFSFNSFYPSLQNLTHRGTAPLYLYNRILLI